MSKPASLLRRLGAILYDTLLLFALCMLGSVPFVIMQSGEAVEANDNLALQLTLFAIIYLFFVGFWTRTGSTLGMLAWGLRVETEQQQTPGLASASTRFITAVISWLVIGLGFLWQLWDKDKMTWHDRVSNTRLMHYPKNKKNK